MYRGVRAEPTGVPPGRCSVIIGLTCCVCLRPTAPSCAQRQPSGSPADMSCWASICFSADRASVLREIRSSIFGIGLQCNLIRRTPTRLRISRGRQGAWRRMSQLLAVLLCLSLWGVFGSPHAGAQERAADTRVLGQPRNQATRYTGPVRRTSRVRAGRTNGLLVTRHSTGI